MASFPVGKDDGFGAELAEDCREAEFVLARGLHVGVRDAQSFAPLHAEKLGGPSSFLSAGFGRASRTHFTSGEVENAGFVAALGHFYERAAAAQFHIVGV